MLSGVQSVGRSGGGARNKQNYQKCTYVKNRWE